MSEREVLLAAIRADPDDDITRLVYADALEETAQPVAVARARFIRLQIALARKTPDESYPQPEFELTQEIDALCARWGRAWLAELPGPVAKAVWNQRPGAGAFRRGFVDGVTLGADVFLKTAPALFDAAPITELHLHGGFGDVRALLAGPYVGRLRAVRLSGGWVGNRVARVFAKCPQPGAVRELDLSDCRLSDTGALDLARSTALDRITVLRLRGNRLTGYGIDALATSPALLKLTRLDVTGNPGVRSWTYAERVRYRKRLVF
jgi:uncharacterized protein (TIGR02996 family)